LTRTTHLFREQPQVLRRYQERYEHILVDEFQDTNTAQYELVRSLAGPSHNIFCVGDEDQSIYGFRGADYRNVQRLRKDFPEAKVILLEQNYRYTQTPGSRQCRHRPQRTPYAQEALHLAGQPQ
jgi:DNA helicase-2/ATP-dependent DNA helicase PcrA